MKRLNECLMALCVIAACPVAHAATWTTIDHPNAGPGGTYPTGISGGNVVGYYIGQSTGQRGFLYNGSTFTTIEAPAPAAFTWAAGIDGDNIVGYYMVETSPTTYVTHGFLLNGSTFTTLDCTLPGAVDTLPVSIDGDKIVGLYFDQARRAHGFIYDGTTFVAVDDPATSGETRLLGISGNQVVGYSDNRAFVSNGFAFQTLTPPGAGAWQTVAAGVDGDNIVGYYDTFRHDDVPPTFQRSGFIFDGSAYTTINHPLAGPQGMTQPSDIEGNRVIGSYRDVDGDYHGFISIVPEPGAIWLAIAAIPAICSVRNPRCAVR